MTNEIKELLDEMKEVAEYSTASNLVRELDSKDCNLLLDYINNLQQKIDKAVEYIEEDIKGNYFKRYEDEVYKMCDDLLDILRGDE